MMGDVFSSTDWLTGSLVAIAMFYALTIAARRSTELRVWWAALTLKLASSLAFMFYSVFVFEGGDTLGYHAAGVDYAALMRAAWSEGSLSVFGDYAVWSPALNSTIRTAYLSGLLHSFLNDSFIAVSFAFALIGLIGQALVYRTFVERYPEQRLRRWWQLGILFLPSLVFWSAGLLKDPLGILGVGLLIWSVNRFVQQPRMTHVLLLLLGAYILFLFRLQVLPVLLVALAPWLLATRAHSTWSAPPWLARWLMHRSVRYALVALAVSGVLAVGVIEPRYSLAHLPESIAAQSAAYELLTTQGNVADPNVITFEPTWLGLLSAWAPALVLTLFRPFIWESISVAVQVAALENIVLLVLTLRAAGHVLVYPHMLRAAFRSPMFLTCVIFTLLFALLVGVATPNLGTLSRYRLPMLPFFIGTLAILEHAYWQVHIQRKAAAVTAAVRSV